MLYLKLILICAIFFLPVSTSMMPFGASNNDKLQETYQLENVTLESETAYKTMADVLITECALSCTQHVGQCSAPVFKKDPDDRSKGTCYLLKGDDPIESNDLRLMKLTTKALKSDGNLVFVEVCLIN